jgi:farnesyl-diphosphate farnesyltransferase
VPNPIDRCHALLPGVSRTFALLIPELPAPLRDTVGVAYLLCRIADTIEDHTEASLETRLRAFDAYQALIDAPDRAAARSQLADLTEPWTLDADHRALLHEAGTVLAAFDSLPPFDRDVIRDCVAEMISGMRETVTEHADHGRARLADIAVLERYCYYVAGIVGRMLTRLFWRHAHGAQTPPNDLVAQGVTFGLGLQITNILKDHRADATRGVTYVPRSIDDATDTKSDTRQAGLLPEPLLAALIHRAADWLDTSFQYALRWPPTATGIRVFCLGALMMAVRTLAIVFTRQASLAPDESPKITRADVTDIMTRARAEAANDATLHAWYAAERLRLDQQLASHAPRAT